MLQVMRDKIQGLIAGIFAVIISLTFVLWGIQNYLHTGGANQVVAKVNGKEITQNQVNIAYEQSKRSEALRFGAGFVFDQNVQMQIKKSILQQLIREEIILQSIFSIGLGIGQEQLWGAISGLPIFQVNGHFSLDRFQQIVTKLFVSEVMFFDNIKKSLLQAQLVEGIINSAFILPNEIANTQKIFRQLRDFNYLVITPEHFAKTVSVTDADLNKYYEQHQNEFLIPEKISIQYVRLASNDLKVGQVSPEQLTQYYHNNLAAFTTPKRWQVVKAIATLSETADPKVVAATRKKILDCIKNKGNLAKLDGVLVTTVWLTKNEVGATLASQLDKLNIGQFSEPFLSKEGYGVVKVLAVQPEKTEPYRAVAAKVKQMYERQQLAQAFSDASDKLSDLTYTNSDTLEPAAKELNLKIQTSDLITKNGEKQGVFTNNKIVTAAFSDAVLRQGYNSSLIETDPGSVIVLRIKEHIPEKVRPLSEVRSLISQKLKQQEMQKKAYDLSQELMVELQKNKSMAEVAKKYNLVEHVVTNAKHDQDEIDTKLVNAAFRLPQLEDGKVVVDMVNTNGDYVIVSLRKVFDDTVHTETAREANILKLLAEQYGQFDYQLLIDHMQHKAKIKIFDTSLSS